MDETLRTTEESDSGAWAFFKYLMISPMPDDRKRIRENRKSFMEKVPWIYVITWEYCGKGDGSTSPRYVWPSRGSKMSGAAKRGVKPRGESSRNMNWFHFAHMYVGMRRAFPLPSRGRGITFQLDFLNVRQSVNAFCKVTYIHTTQTIPRLIPYLPRWGLSFLLQRNIHIPFAGGLWKSKKK